MTISVMLERKSKSLPLICIKYITVNPSTILAEQSKGANAIHSHINATIVSTFVTIDISGKPRKDGEKKLPFSPRTWLPKYPVPDFTANERT